MDYPKPYIHPLSASSPAPVATGGKVQPKSPRGPKLKKVSVKAHTRTVKPKVAKTTGGAVAPAVTPQNALLDAAVRLRFGGQDQALTQQLQGNARFSSGVPAWYAQAINEIKGIGATSAAQGQQSIAQAQNYSSPAAVTGTPDAAQAANARNSLNSQYATMLTRDQQANQDFLARLQAGMQTQQGNVLNQTNRERQGLLSQQGQLAGQKGDFRVLQQASMDAAAQKVANDQANLQVKQDTVDYLTNKAVSGAKTARSNTRTARLKLQHQGAVDRHDAMLADNKFKLDQKKYGLAVAKQKYKESHPAVSEQKAAADLKYFQKHGYYPPTGPPKGGTTAAEFTPTQIRASQKSFRQAIGAVKEGQFKKGQGVVADQYLSVKGIKDPLLRKAAILTKFYGGVDKATQHAVKVNYGITLALKK